MRKFISIFQNRTIKLTVHIVLTFSLVFLGFFVGKNNQPKLENKDTEIKTDCEKQTKELRDELSAVLNNQAQLLGTKKQAYSRDEIGVYSSLFDGKQVEVWTYKYKTKNIIRKRIEINDYSGVEIWEYASVYYPTDGPKDFAIFGGYENYANKATLIEEIKKNWKKLYKTKKGIEMYYEYEYAPKSIGVIVLDSYHSYFPNFKYSKPTLIQIWYSKIDGFPTSEDNPLVLKAKKELNKIADSIDIGFPEEKPE